MSRWNAFAAFVLAALLSASAWGTTAAGPGTPNDQQPQPGSAVGPGALNYVEGQANIDDETVNNDAIGSAVLQPGQMLSTATGKAEILLMPGTFLRVGGNSTVRMVSETPMDVTAELTRGQATVEVLQTFKHSVLAIDEGGKTIRLEQKGLYEFDADHQQVFVYKGKAVVQVGEKRVAIKGGHELDLNQSGELETRRFNKTLFENSDLVQFSGRRSEYLAEANANAARAYYAGSAGWYGAGWYWDPEFWAYTWVPGDDYCYDAFGWGFYSPWWVYDDPFLFAGFFGDFGFGSFGHRHHGHGRLPPSFSGSRGFARQGDHTTGQPPAMAQSFGATGTAFSHPAFNRGGAMGGAFHGGGFAGGSGFHGGGGGGGFHGGGFAGGGGFHGGGGGGGGHAGGGGFGGGGFGGGHR